MSFTDDLENSIDIVDLIGRYTKLKKTGANYKSLCPFPGHSEKTASFVVSPSKQIGYCFGCHKGGGPIKFIMDMESCEFREALQILGNITGKEIPGYTENKEKIEIKKNLYSLYKDATNYYKIALEKNPEVKKYLVDRGLTSEDIKKFHFGYADSGVSLYNYLKEKGYEDELISKSQIFLDVKRRKDKFIGRIIFPIQNLRGDFVAFAGRILGKGEPKYLNSPASDIYDKSSILYGLFDARNTITKVDHVIITEGYMDAISLHRAGFFQAVAVSGTALTEKHIQIIKRLTHKIYLCFDGDKAGESATKNSLEILKNKGLEVKIISLGAGKDPDEFLESGGDFDVCIKNALSPIAFLIEKNNYNLESLDEKKKFLAEIFAIIESYSDEIEKVNYLREISQITETPLEVIYESFKNRKKSPREKPIQVEKIGISSEEILMSYLIFGNISPEKISQNFLFPDKISENFKKTLNDPETHKKNLPLEKKEKLKALYFTESEKYRETKETENRIYSLIGSLNKNIYKNLSESLKKSMNSGDENAILEYSKLLTLAKKHGLK